MNGVLTLAVSSGREEALCPEKREVHKQEAVQGGSSFLLVYSSWPWG